MTSRVRESKTRLLQMRMNIGVSFNDPNIQEQSDLVPPLRILAPWAFKVSRTSYRVCDVIRK